MKIFLTSHSTRSFNMSRRLVFSMKKKVLISTAESHVTDRLIVAMETVHVSNSIKIGRSARFHLVRRALRKSLFRVDMKRKVSERKRTRKFQSFCKNDFLEMKKRKTFTFLI